ncbi:hypothetical protein [Ferrovibrio sp.]|uniref:hypothetical protein n=1 Tax=Ferrovibrio sp. TaxID=1917215 RepID=UPI0035B1D984
MPQDPLPAAQQNQHLQGVPHTDRQGRVRFAYDAAASFFPIGIYHALHGEAFGRSHDLAQSSQAGFNTVHLWPMQDIPAALTAARRLGLQAIVQQPSEDFVAAQRGNPAVLAWMIEDEPSAVVSAADTPAHLADYDTRAARYKAIDPDRGMLLLDAPGISRTQYWRWRHWLTRPDIHMHFNYPFARRLDPVRNIERVAVSVSRAVRFTDQRKPIWFVAQAFEEPRRSWYMPDADQLRAMVFAAIIHGASGIVYFGYDSHATRDDNVLGIAPDPLIEYGDTPDYNNNGLPHLRTDAAGLQRSKALWHGVEAINRELAALAPSLLQPTLPYVCNAQTAKSDGLAQPIRLLAKPALATDGILLLAVNLENQAHDVRLDCPAGFATVSSYSPDQMPPMQQDGTSFTDRFPPFGVRLYRIVR